MYANLRTLGVSGWKTLAADTSGWRITCEKAETHNGLLRRSEPTATPDFSLFFNESTQNL